MKERNRPREIPFTKMVGTGNDFILIDNRADCLNGDLSPLVQRLCSRRVSVGADGLLLLEESDQADFKMRYFNADGGEAAFCGNGARCIARYAVLSGIAGKQMSFESETGIHRAWVNETDVTIDMPEPTDRRLDVALSEVSMVVHSVTVGVPHVVIFVEHVGGVDVVGQGRVIRHSEQFRPAGTNVNFVQVLPSGELVVRTYERGVEDETYSCGTGICASAVIAHLVRRAEVPVEVFTNRGERLTVSFQSQEDKIVACTLTGEARVVYQGKLMIR
jgi:diaminopimelate epimerase